jgi:hypothetical protein
MNQTNGSRLVFRSSQVMPTKAESGDLHTLDFPKFLAGIPALGMSTPCSVRCRREGFRWLGDPGANPVTRIGEAKAYRDLRETNVE